MANIQRRSGKWRVQIRLKGSRPITGTFDRKTDAVKWAGETETEVRNGRYFPTREERERTLADAIVRYRAAILPHYKPREQRQRGAKLDWWEEQLGDRRLVHLTAADIAECREALELGRGISGKRLSPATQTRYLAALRHVLSLARREWEWMSENPAQRVRSPREPRGRLRFLSADERGRLLEACRPDQRLYALVMIALGTGARQGELLRLRWRDIDLLRGTALLGERKNGERGTVTLIPQVVDALRAIVRRVGVEHIFAGGRGIAAFPRREWEEALDRAGITDFHFHDLRHTFASYLAMSGATLAELAEALGHKTLAMVKRYAHLTEQHTSGVVRRMGEKFLA